MDDKRIVELYFARDEEALVMTHKKYGRYCYRIAYNILYESEDAKECVNDTYLRTWNAIPPHRPVRLPAFLGKITRNLALDRYDYNVAQKRSGKTAMVYEEVAECISHPDAETDIADEVALKIAVDSFLASLPKKQRMIFLRRYYYFSSIHEIARDFSQSESNTKVILHRLRGQFKEHLASNGIYL